MFLVAFFAFEYIIQLFIFNFPKEDTDMKKRWVAAVLAGMITGAVLLSGCGGRSSAADSAGQEAAGSDQQAGQEAENTGAAGTGCFTVDCLQKTFHTSAGGLQVRPQ